MTNRLVRHISVEESTSIQWVKLEAKYGRIPVQLELNAIGIGYIVTQMVKKLIRFDQFTATA